MTEFTHIDDKGRVRMVDVADKPPTDRTAVAQARVSMNPDTFIRISENRVRKGNVLETARIAGILAAKRTHELIPMCHPIQIRHVQIDFFPDAESSSIRIEASVRALDRTGVEMEALTAVSTAALTLYDMCKSHDREMTISDILLLRKTGGKSGDFKRSR
ncbi:MAG: cyclic pyranopterin monophosphate synthase MoaC [Desulfobacterales bacterium]